MDTTLIYFVGSILSIFQNNNTELSIIELAREPVLLWTIAIIGAVCVVGIVQFLKCFQKPGAVRQTRWTVLLFSVFIGLIISPLIPKWIATFVITTLLILALAVICKQYLIDGLQSFVSKIFSSQINSRSSNESQS